MVRELLCNFKDYMSTWFYNKETMDSKLAEKSDVTHTHDNVSTSSNGFMLASDKTKLDGIPSNANYITVQDIMSYINDNCMLFIDDNGELILTNATLTTSDLTKTFGDDNKFIARLLDPDSGEPIAGETVEFTIQGVNYFRTTDTDGYAKQNINLMKGIYTIITTYGSISNTNTIIVN